jgi:nucleotide-binding universal stress UspA family protein
MSLELGKSVVVPIDFGDLTELAINSAIRAADSASAVTIVNVAPDLTAIEPGVAWGEVSDESRRNELVKLFRERYPQFSSLRFEVLFGDAGHQIANYAQKLEASLIVIPSHGRTGIKHLLIGSTAERVVRFAHCPVLVLRN